MERRTTQSLFVFSTLTCLGFALSPTQRIRSQQSMLQMASSPGGRGPQFSLASVRQSLIRQEETIIFALIERAQFRRNDAIYQVPTCARGLTADHTAVLH